MVLGTNMIQYSMLDIKRIILKCPFMSVNSASWSIFYDIIVANFKYDGGRYMREVKNDLLSVGYMDVEYDEDEYQRMIGNIHNSFKATFGKNIKQLTLIKVTGYIVYIEVRRNG